MPRRALQEAIEEHGKQILFVELDERITRSRTEARVLALLEEAQKLRREGELDGALDLVVESLALAPTHRLARELRREVEKALRVEALVASARDNLASGNAEDAVADLRAALRLDPNREDVPEMPGRGGAGGKASGAPTRPRRRGGGGRGVARRGQDRRGGHSVCSRRGRSTAHCRRFVDWRSGSTTRRVWRSFWYRRACTASVASSSQRGSS